MTNAGGKRKGAGKKPLLSPMQRMALYAEYQDRVRTFMLTMQRDEIRQKERLQDLDYAIEQLEGLRGLFAADGIAAIIVALDIFEGKRNQISCVSCVDNVCICESINGAAEEMKTRSTRLSQIYGDNRIIRGKAYRGYKADVVKDCIQWAITTYGVELKSSYIDDLIKVDRDVIVREALQAI